MTIKAVTMGLASSALFVAGALAHGGATGIVKDRMDGMGVMREAMKTLTPMMQGSAEFDVEAVRAAAEEIGQHAGDAMTELFPEGSDGDPSEAKPDIWENWEEFAALAEQIHVLSEGLALASENGLSTDAMQGAGIMSEGSMMGTSPMMGGSSMMGGTTMMALEELAEMPADRVFLMVSQTCTACHTRFRAE